MTEGRKLGGSSRILALAMRRGREVCVCYVQGGKRALCARRNMDEPGEGGARGHYAQHCKAAAHVAQDLLTKHLIRVSCCMERREKPTSLLEGMQHNSSQLMAVSKQVGLVLTDFAAGGVEREGGKI